MLLPKWLHYCSRIYYTNMAATLVKTHTRHLHPPSFTATPDQTHPRRLYALVMKCFLTWNCLSRRDRRRHARLSRNNLCSRLRARMSPSFLAIFSHLGQTDRNNSARCISGSYVCTFDRIFFSLFHLAFLSLVESKKCGDWRMSSWGIIAKNQSELRKKK